MKFFTLLFFLFFTCAVSFAQSTFSKGYRTLSLIDSSRSNRSVSFDLYYPADVAGTNVPIAFGTTSFPVVVFGHGFTITAGSYTLLSDTLTRNGYIIALPTTEGGFSPSHDNFGKDLSFLAQKIINLGNDPTSFLFQRVLPKAAVGGHSMGGGCSFLSAASGNQQIKALFNMAAAETTPSALTAASNVQIPTLIFSGSSDCIVPPATQSNLYNNVPSSCKSWVNITGATHCQFSENNFNCVFGQVSSGCNSSSVNVSSVYTKVFGLLLPFLDYNLKGDCQKGIDYITNLNTMTGAVIANVCTAPDCSVLAFTFKNFIGKLNNDNVVLSWTVNEEDDIHHYNVESSIDGTSFSVVFKQMPRRQNGTNLYELNNIKAFGHPAYYRIAAYGNNGSVVYSKVIRLFDTDEKDLMLDYYPNPVLNSLNVWIKDPLVRAVKYQICNDQGVVVMKGNNRINTSSGIFTFPLEHLSGGHYLFTLENEKGLRYNSFRIFKK